MSRAYNAMAHLTFPTATLSVKPLHLDGRIEEKVNQSRGFGFPVVAASVADGMDLCGRRNVVIAVSFAEVRRREQTFRRRENYWKDYGGASSDSPCRRSIYQNCLGDG